MSLYRFNSQVSKHLIVVLRKVFCVCISGFLAYCRHEPNIRRDMNQAEKSQIRKSSVAPTSILRTPEVIKDLRQRTEKKNNSYSKNCSKYFKQLSEENAPSYKWMDYKKKCSIPEF